MKTTISWRCLSCRGEPTFNHPEFIQHIREIHGVPPGAKVKSKGILYLDGKGFHERHYEVSYNDLKFYKVERDENGR